MVTYLIFGQNITNRSRIRLLLLSFLLLLSGCEGQPQRTPNKFLIPQGYIGWVEVKYNIPKAPALPMMSGMYVYRIPPSGLLSTSTQAMDGGAKDEYYYVKGKATVLLDSSEGNRGMVWGEGYTEDLGNPSIDVSRIFIGSRQQYSFATQFMQDEYRINVNVLNARVKGRNLSYKDFAKKNLSHLNLKGANFCSSSLNATNCRNSDFSYALLLADLHKADFRNANLQYADLHDCNLQYADLRGADLRHANLKGTILKGVKYDKFTKWPKEMSLKQVTSRTAK